MIVPATILEQKGKILLLKPDKEISRELAQRKVRRVEILLCDGREISVDQRKKIFAIIRDISLWSGHDPEYLRQYLTWDFCGKNGIEVFSLSNVDMSTAKEFINYLIEFCFLFSVPAKDTLLHQTDDIGRYLYLCLEHRRCAICNKPAEVHHVDRIGMGNNREDIVHVGLEAVALCHDHHMEAHVKGDKELFEEYFIYGIQLDEYLCERLNLRRKSK